MKKQRKIIKTNKQTKKLTKQNMANRLKNCICQKFEILSYKGTDVLRKWRANGDGCGKKWVY